MTNIVSEFDPATETDPDIHSMQHGEYGIYFTNESIYGIKLTFGQGVATRIVPPFQAKPLHICITGDTFQWEIRYALPTGGQAPPASLCVVEIFQQSELADLPLVATDLTRISNVGNSIPVSTAIAAGQVTAGVFMAGVFLPAVQVADGLLGAGVKVDAESVQPGQLAAGVLLPAANVQAGFLGTGVAIGQDALRMMGRGGGGPLSTNYGIVCTNAIELATDVNMHLSWNSYWNGADYYMSNGPAAQLIMDDANGPRWRNGPIGTTGGAVTWYGSLNIAMFNSAGGGAAGRTIWVGTTDPGSAAAEGDIWIAG